MVTMSERNQIKSPITGWVIGNITRGIIYTEHNNLAHAKNRFNGCPEGLLEDGYGLYTREEWEGIEVTPTLTGAQQADPYDTIDWVMGAVWSARRNGATEEAIRECVEEALKTAPPNENTSTQ